MTDSLAVSDFGRMSRAQLGALLADLLTDVFALEGRTIDPATPFDAYGLDSIDAVLATDALGARLGIDLSPEFLMQHRTLDEVTDAVARLLTDHQVPEAAARPTVFLFAGGGGRDSRLQRLADRCGEGFAFEQVALGDWQDWIEDGTDADAIVARCCRQIEERCPEGPVRLAAYSQGGYVAFATALALKQRGRQIGWMALFDSAASPLYPQIHLVRRMRWIARGLTRATFAALQNAHRRIGLPVPGWIDRIDQSSRFFRVMAEGVQLFDGASVQRLARRLVNSRRGVLGERALLAFESALQIHMLDRLWRRWFGTGPARAIAIDEGEVLLFRSQRPGSADLGWAAHCPGLRIVPVDGDHLTMFDPARIGELAERFTASVPEDGMKLAA
ncbi:thioesterase domain-containing protein/acyl carrier protein [Sphingomonas zeicaulis]|uniref:phosphopantetheine-binding protein n=1 Tax=Sphingomonas zeicaulis TaxID=1632740 RepID=UPI003D1A3A26